MVWLLPGADASRISIVMILTYTVGLSSLNHVVAGSTTLFYLIASGSLSFDFVPFGLFAADTTR
jgi:hypothetical protein